MEISLDNIDWPDVSTKQRTSNELAKLVRKLRWIGMKEEAEHMQLVLCRIDLAATFSANPSETN